MPVATLNAFAYVVMNFQLSSVFIRQHENSDHWCEILKTNTFLYSQVIVQMELGLKLPGQ